MLRINVFRTQEKGNSQKQLLCAYRASSLLYARTQNMSHIQQLCNRNSYYVRTCVATALGCVRSLASKFFEGLGINERQATEIN